MNGNEAGIRCNEETVGFLWIIPTDPIANYLLTVIREGSVKKEDRGGFKGIQRWEGGGVHRRRASGK